MGIPRRCPREAHLSSDYAPYSRGGRGTHGCIAWAMSWACPRGAPTEPRPELTLPRRADVGLTGACKHAEGMLTRGRSEQPTSPQTKKGKHYAGEDKHISVRRSFYLSLSRTRLTKYCWHICHREERSWPSAVSKHLLHPFVFCVASELLKSFLKLCSV